MERELGVLSVGYLERTIKEMLPTRMVVMGAFHFWCQDGQTPIRLGGKYHLLVSFAMEGCWFRMGNFDKEENANITPKYGIHD